MSERYIGQPLEERLEELEKKVQENIASLSKYFCNLDGSDKKMWDEQIAYNRHEVTSLKDNVDSNRGQINANLEIVLQDHLKSHIDVARDQLTDKDKLTIFREFDEAIQKQLEKLDSNIKVTISRNDGEKGKNSKEVISSNENNLSTPERRKDGDSKEKWQEHDEACYQYCSEQLDELFKDGEKEVEEMSNKNLCREESNIDILPPSKPSRIICKKGVCTYGEPVEYCERYNCKCYNYEKLHEIPKEPTPSKECTPKNLMKAFGLKKKEPTPSEPCLTIHLNPLPFPTKEPTEKEDHEFDYDYNCVKCGKNLLELVDRTYLTIEFDTHNTHKIVLKEDLEEWYYLLKDKIFPKIGILEKGDILDGIEKYLKEEDDEVK